MSDLTFAGRISRRRFALGAAGVVAAAWSGRGWGGAYGIRGRMAPELEVDYWIDAHGAPTRRFKVSEAGGKWVFLKCFQKWCPGCHSHGLPTLKRVADAFADAFEAFFEQMRKARVSRWKETSRKAALEHLEMLESLTTLK